MDNSGSMYPPEMCEGSEGNDVDFKRVDMCKELIEMSDFSEILFGLAKFTATYTELLSGFDNEKEDLITALDSIKTTEETFNGTYIAKSIRDALNNFSETDNSHRKFILLLTDGATTEGGLWDWSFYDEDNAIKDANDKNVSIIIIGLGNEVDNEYLMKIANGTGGAFIYANNDNALTELYDTIQAGLNYNMVDSDGDGENDRLLIADTGFEADKNGFRFPNLSIRYNGENGGGICYGMAAFAQLYYADQLPLTAKKVEKHDAVPESLFSIMLEADAADISENAFFSSDNNYANTDQELYQYNLYSLYDYIREAPSEEIYQRDVDNEEKLIFQEDIRKQIEESGILIIIEKSWENGYYWSVDQETYNSVERVIFSFDVNPEELDKEALDAYNLLKFLYNYWATQGWEEVNVREYNLNPKIFTEDAIEDSFNQMIADLKDGVALTICGASHAITATALYRDIENPSEYILEVYDNNSPGETKEIHITKYEYNKFSLNETAWFNDYGYEVRDAHNSFMQGENAVIRIEFVSFVQ